MIQLPQSESDIQRDCATYLGLSGLLWFHPPNGAYLGGGKQRIIRGQQLKAQGMSSGVPDICIMTPASNGLPSFVELKTKRGSLSPSQKEWRDNLQACGYNWGLARSLENMIGLLRDWGYPLRS